MATWRPRPRLRRPRLGELGAAAEVVQGHLQAVHQVDLRLPAEDLAGLGDVGLAHLGVVLGQLQEGELRARAGQLEHGLGELQDRHLAGVADVRRQGLVGLQQPVDAVHQVRHVAEGARLAAVAEDGQGLAAQGLAHEGRQGAPVVQAHARTVGVEDPHDAALEGVVPVVAHGHRLGEALGLVVDAAGPDRVDVTPVVLLLGVHQGVAVALRGRGQEEARALRVGQTEGFVGPERADLEGLDRVVQVVDRARRRGEVQDGVQAPGHVDELGHVLVDEVELRLGGQVLDVAQRAGDQVVHADHLVAFGQEAIGEVAAEETGAAGDQVNTLLF